MPIDPELRLLDIDIPAQPESLVKLSLLLAEEDVDLKALSTLVESDMALAAAVLKAVNSSLYGLSGRVQSVQQAITYLGTREVAAVTFEMGLRAVFPHAPELAPIWERAAMRGVLMGRIGAALGVDPWIAHSAGLFEECGKAVLFRHASARYKPLLAAADGDDAELLRLEQAEFGVGHDRLVRELGPRGAGGGQRAPPCRGAGHARAAAAVAAPCRVRAVGHRPRADDRARHARGGGPGRRAAGAARRDAGAARRKAHRRAHPGRSRARRSLRSTPAPSRCCARPGPARARKPRLARGRTSG
jgi:hypothetical protein